MAAAPAVWAQSHDPTDREVASLTALARAALPMARIEDGTPVPEETAEELDRPVVPRAAEVLVIRRGELSGLMAGCGLDWQKQSYLPLLNGLRTKGWSGKQLAYAGLLHGMSQGMTQRALPAQPACSPGDVAALAQEAASLSLAIE